MAAASSSAVADGPAASGEMSGTKAARLAEEENVCVW